MFGIVLLIITAIRAYKIAKGGGRNAILRMLAAVGVYIGVVIGFAIINAAGQEFPGWSEDYFYNNILSINALPVILSLIGILTVARYTGKPIKMKLL